MSNCYGCKSNHYPAKNSWDGLHRGNWQYEGYCRGGSNYDTTATSWTRAANVTQPSFAWGTKFQPVKEGFSAPPAHTENFCYGNHSTYSSLSQTWAKQKPYTTG